MLANPRPLRHLRPVPVASAAGRRRLIIASQPTNRSFHQERATHRSSRRRSERACVVVYCHPGRMTSLRTTTLARDKFAIGRIFAFSAVEVELTKSFATEAAE